MQENRIPEVLLGAIVAMLEDMIVCVDSGRRITAWQTPASGEAYVRPVEFLGRSLADVLPEDLAGRFDEAFSRSFESGSQTFDYSLEMPGRTNWYSARIAAAPSGGWVVMIRNITRLRDYAHALEMRTAQLNAQFENMPLATFVYRSFAAGITLQRLNEAARRMIGATADRFIGRLAGEMFSARPDILASFELCLRERTSFTRELEFAWIPGASVRSLIVDFVFVPPDMVMVHVNDIDEFRRTKYKARLSEFVIESAIEGVVLTDPSGNIESVNPAFTAITGYGADEAIGRNPRILKSDRHDESFYGAMWKALVERGRWDGEIWNRRKNGETFPEMMSISAIRDENGLLRHYVSVFTDISDVKLRDERIAHQAMHDALTDLPNRHLLSERIEFVLARMDQEQELLLPLLFIDIDHFKYINDSHGHLVGDHLLIQIARRLEPLLSAGATLARVGGDDFIILLEPVETAAEISSFVQSVTAAFNAAFAVGAEEYYLSASIGIGAAPGDGGDAVMLIKNAELAMYHAKKSGRNTWQFFSEEMDREAGKRIGLQGSLRRALEEGQFVLHYQPIVDSVAGRVVSAEALVRWQDPARGLVSPAEFIGALEENGLIVALGDWILKSALAAAAGWQDVLPGVGISVNIAARQFSEADFTLGVFRCLDASGLPPELLALEITENTIMGKRRSVMAAMEQIKRMGIKLSIDDFGTGYSSLAYLKRFDADYLKIDRSFVVDLPGDRDSVSIARAVIALAGSLGLTTIAEGAETEEQVRFLRDMGCARIQGYRYSRPLPLPEFIEFSVNGVGRDETLREADENGGDAGSRR